MVIPDLQFFKLMNVDYCGRIENKERSNSVNHMTVPFVAGNE